MCTGGWGVGWLNWSILFKEMVIACGQKGTDVDPWGGPWVGARGGRVRSCGGEKWGRKVDSQKAHGGAGTEWDRLTGKWTVRVSVRKILMSLFSKELFFLMAADLRDTAVHI